jgi:hypothetical protein
VLGCVTGPCSCPSYWNYITRDDGAWTWSILNNIFMGHHGGCDSSFWTVTVTADGMVSLSPDLNHDDLVDGADLGLLLMAWAGAG